MFRQNQILRTLSAPSSRGALGQVLSDRSLDNRTAIAHRVCERFGFFDVLGKTQVATCAKALSKLEARGEIVLPAPLNSHAKGSSPRLLPAPVPAAEGVPLTLDGIEDLALELVETDEQRAVFNTLMHHEHPRGVTTLVGAQVRYLITSAHGYVAAVGFSASALRLADRERYLAWSEAQRRALQHHVVCLSRFLVRVPCKHLASHVLGRVLQRLPIDMGRRYGYRPWVVETYVAPDQEGTCFKAANFVRIGQTAGGRPGPDGEPEPPKALYVYELDRTWRRRLGVARVEASPVRLPHEGISSEAWAETEFGGAPLGDVRLSARLVKSASMLADVTGGSIVAHTAHDAAAVKGHYRLLESKEGSAVTPENILAPHRERTIERMRSQKVVLCVQDGTKLNYATRPACSGLQVIGTNQTETETLGVPLHMTMAMTADGLPLGVLRCSYKKPDTGPEAPGTQQWLNGYADVCEARKALSRKSSVVLIMDREADSFALYDLQRTAQQVHVLVRAKGERLLVGGQKLIASLKSVSRAETIEIEISRVTARPKASRRKVRAARSYRMANAEVRYKRVELPDPRGKAAALSLYGVHVRETNPPGGQNPLEWVLLTSIKLHTAEDAVRMLDYYLKRWRIEDFFWVLKSGCKVESMALRTALRLERAITIWCVVAWRIMVLTLLGRTVPELDAEVFFTEMELRFLSGYATRVKLPPPRTLQQAILAVAVLGGYQNRSRDGPPGHQIMWRGMDRLSLTTLGYEIRDAQH